MKNSKFQIISIFIYFLLLSTPLFWHLFMPLSESNENRSLAELPTWPKSWSAVESSKVQMDAYLDDNFGLRQQFIDWTNIIKFHVFGEVNSARITIGKSGYIYANSHSEKTPNSMIKELCDINIPNKSRRGDISNGIESFINYYRARQIKTLFVVIPTKPRIYPEYLPIQQKNWCEGITTNWAERLFSKMNNKSILFPINQYKEWKQLFPVYLSTFFHWNGKTPAMTAEFILNYWHINATPEQQPHENVVSSDLSNHLSGLTFTDNSVVYNFENLESCQGKKCMEDFATKYQNGALYSYKSKLNSNRKLLILSDSFGPQIAPHFSRGFDQVFSVNLNYLKAEEEQTFFDWIENYTQPTHIIFLIHDGGLVWQTLRLERIMAALTLAEIDIQ